jgi:Flp pilus assembly protein TadD
MVCHNSYPTTVPYAEGKYVEVPQGIGCERCHGPGERHVEARLADAGPPGVVDSTIVNPAHLSLDLRLDVCQQCHLHTTVSLLRDGRTPFDFRPSQALDDYLTLFSVDVPASSDEIDVISHADRMKQSACFLETQGQSSPMDCVTCHNPHEGFREKGPSYFNTTCLSCHPAAGLQARLEGKAAQNDHVDTANCIACHMPKVKADGAPHSSFTDHWIRVVERDPAPQPVATHAKTVLEPYFPKDREGPDADVYEGMAYVVYGQQSGNTADLEEGVTRLRQALAAAPEHGEGQFILGFALQQLGRVEESIPPLEEAVRLGADIPERLNALAQSYEAAGRDPAVISRLYLRALSIQPDLAEVRINYGRFLEAQGRSEEALTAYQQAVDEQPWLATAHYNLGTANLQRGEAEAAERSLREALHLMPVYPEALGNLGLLYATQGRLEDARAVFEEAVEVAPDHPVALGNLGAFYLNNNDETAAIEVLARAVEIDSGYVDALANLALAHLREGNETQARRYAQQALDADPTHALARQILASF